MASLVALYTTPFFNIFQPDWLEAAFPHSHFKRPVLMTSAALRRKQGTAGRIEPPAAVALFANTRMA